MKTDYTRWKQWESDMEDQYPKIVDLIKKSQHIVVFSGAGISTNSGILDFRSPDGLYSLIEQNYDLPYPEALLKISPRAVRAGSVNPGKFRTYPV